MKTYVFDIDGTICSQTAGDYENAMPYKRRIKTINRLFEEGNIIIFQTARGMGRFNNDSKKAIDMFHSMTVKQLAAWEVKYHMLFLGKPAADFYIDDKGVSDENFFDSRG